MSDESWGVVLTADEPAPLVLANIGWHLGSGASEVHLYLDRPGDPVARALSGLSGVHVTLCDGAHWAALGGERPDLQMRRQALNANHALARCGAGWLLHLDADEFLVQDRPWGRELASVRALGAELSLPVWERAYLDGAPPDGLFDGVLRGSTRGASQFDAQIFRGARHLQNGLLAYSAGKCAVPVGAGLRLGVHWAYVGHGKERATQYRSTHARILHFDGLTPLHWLVKLARYAQHAPEEMVKLISEHRRTQVHRFLRNATGAGAARRFHDRMRVLGAEEAARLDGFGLLDRQPFNPAEAIARALGQVPDLGNAGFDDEVRARFPEAARLVETGL